MAIQTTAGGSSLGEILEKILDKGVVIAGDISISLAEVELLTIKIRLVVASVDKAMEIGIDWWRNDPYLSSAAKLIQEEKLIEENRQLKENLEMLQQEIKQKDKKLPLLPRMK